MTFRQLVQAIFALAAAIFCATALNGCASSNDNPNDKPGSLPGRPGQIG